MPKPFENAEVVFFEQSDPRCGRLPYTGFTVSWAGCGLVACTTFYADDYVYRTIRRPIYRVRIDGSVRTRRVEGKDVLVVRSDV